ncbi:helix-turn-helix domain-containing protein [Paraburkholderia diazotrophica]|uniref:helix-turn-helix domain-containing protein n=1 Tax=Paraburkholderia diazotrophica TaxID=667676 RepID=UPI00319E24B4
MKILHYAAPIYQNMARLMVTKAELSEIMTLPQVALFLKVTERTIYRLAAAKEIPAFKVGGSWRFSLSDIEVWIKEQSQLSFERSDK